MVASRVLIAGITLLLGGGSAAGQDLSSLSLEELMNVEVTSVSRRREQLAESAAAVFVLTSEDIRRSGALTIPDLLRLVPGLHVAQLDSNKWAVSARGFGSRFSNKLLVMVDGRSVYSPLFSGVFWDLVNVPLDSIERIEVVRGPGATMWGANAVNGVINIITRSAFGSTGLQASIGSGTEERMIGSLQAGRLIGQRSAIRVNLSGHDRDGSAGFGSANEIDVWRNGRGGARIDVRPTDRHDVSFQGGWASSRATDEWQTPTYAAPYVVTRTGRIERDSAFASALWTARSGRGITTSYLQGGLERVHDYTLGQDRRDLSLGVQHAQSWGPLADLVFGAEVQTDERRYVR